MMRTYSRKRPHNQLIEDIHQLCRLCLNKAMEGTPIFTEGTDNVCATLALRIMICVGLEVKREDCLPNVICKECYNELDKYYAFRKRCEVTYQKLKSHVLAVKENEYKQRLQEEMERKNKLREGDNEGLKFVVTFDKDQFAEVNVLNLNGVAQVNNFIEKLPDLEKINENIESQVSTTNMEEDTPDPDITTFLSAMLRELGILTQRDDGIVCSNDSIKCLELETGDGSQVMFELIEEDDEEQIHEEKVTDESHNTLLGVEVPKPQNTLLEVEVPKPQNSLLEVEVPKPQNTLLGVEVPKQENCVVKCIISNPPKKTEVLTDKKLSGAGSWCGECGRRLSCRSALARHMRTHSGARPYSCSRCGRSFAQKEVMLRHQLVHEEQRPYQCSECEKSFTQRGALAAHARAHAPANARPLALHRCDRCPKVFLYASGLSRHTMMHNGRVYVCGACERQFKDKSSLLRHLRTASHAPAHNHT